MGSREDLGVRIIYANTRRRNVPGSSRLNPEHYRVRTPDCADLENRGRDVSYSMLSLYIGGVTLWLCYGLVIGATALSLANAASILFAGTCLTLKMIRNKSTGDN